MVSVTLTLDPVIQLGREQFYQLCRLNRDVQLERSASGELIIVAPVGGVSGGREADLITDLNLWNREVRLGKVFSSSTIFSLPGGGDRSPDAAWVRLERWETLTAEQQEAFPPLCPDFVIELRSRTDRLEPLQAKMQEYLDSGLRLGWLIDPQNRKVYIYRQGQGAAAVPMPVVLSGEEVLPSFSLYVT
ncbi:Uma2 family endonuclease [Gloeobacter violaceus]|uniref:Glr2470 protein n=1 Tax=Gloeobacter violaceus (strain ATCC 29082 / PCC 7421) TaxID=251221 RepID=Q7NHR5_GLOVI|nr:Uma2 family endonuclease [Gloeobacter violaceus]BAC90411.1 glr2470 [Gloeobacter violaceus PCC 7421]